MSVEWPQTPIGDLTHRITKGTTPTSIGGQFTDNGINFFKIESIAEDGALISNKLAFIDDDSYRILGRSQLQVDDVLFSIAGAIGRTYLVREKDLPANTNQALAIVRFNQSQVFPLYGYYAMRHRSFQADALGRVTQTAQANVNLTQLANSRIHIPPLDEQNRIASILSAYDDLIENNRRRIHLLEQSAQLLYKEWFVHLRFPGHEHTKIIDGIPEGWKTNSMMQHPHLEFIRENIDPFDGIKRYYATADISDIFITGEGINYTFEEKPSRAQKAPEVGSVWFARMQETYKVLVFTETNRTVAKSSILSSGFAGFRARRPDFLPFLYLLINNERFHKEKDRFCTGATQRSLTNGGLKSICVLAPKNDVVSAFAEYAGPLIDQILTLQSINKQLATARNLLLPRLMNGDVTV